MRWTVPSRGRQAATIATSMFVAVGLLGGAMQLMPLALGSSFPEAQVQAAALAGIRQETTALRAADERDLHILYVGKALATELSLRAHVQQLIAAGTDYPGDVQLSNIRVLGLYGDATSVTVDVAVHVKLANMKQGEVKDYSESDLIYHMILIPDQGTWRIADLSASFAPGAEP